MNPLDNEEFSKLLQTIKEDMPLHTKSSLKIKKTQYGRLPKSLTDYSVKINNEFLNNNLAIIEEINHRDSKHWIPKWFQQYQNKIYGDTEILNHDNFFKAKLHDSFFQYHDEFGMPKNTKYKFVNNPFISFGRVLGGVLESYTGTESNDSIGTTQLLACKMSSAGVIGEWYNQVAIKRGTTGSGGNFRGGIYKETSSLPDTLYGETASTAYGATSAYTYTDLTNGGAALTATGVWVAFCNDASTPVVRILSGVPSAHLRGNLSHAYGALDSPWTGTYDETANNFLYKCRGN